MGRRKNYVVVGRSSDCDVVLTHPSVSFRHARLSWSGDQVVVEDLGSANGVYVLGARIRRASVRPGDEVFLGDCALPWSAAHLKPFLRSGTRGDTLYPEARRANEYRCRNCGSTGRLPTKRSLWLRRCLRCATVV
ncbi:MAG: FHA domain-containing protein, partial [Myxococcales bacterium]|nr:FHA domain-containing protein [Myxococcales bacterium]